MIISEKRLNEIIRKENENILKSYKTLLSEKLYYMNKYKQLLEKLKNNNIEYNVDDYDKVVGELNYYAILIIVSERLKN